MSLDYSSICNIGSRIVDRMGADEGNLQVVGGIERYILTYIFSLNTVYRKQVKLNFKISEEFTTSIALECVCVCVFFPFILDIKFVGRTSRGHTGGRSDRIFHPPSFCGACLNFSREKGSAIPFPRRP